MKHTLCIVSIIVLGVNSCAQHVELSKNSYRYYDAFSQQNIIVDNVQISNNSLDYVMTWVSLDSVIRTSDRMLLHDYFIKRHGDFNLNEMISEGLLGRDYTHSVGVSFLKKIMPGEKFVYIIVKRDEASTFYQDRIAIISRQHVEDYIGAVDEIKFWEPDSIVLVE